MLRKNYGCVRVDFAQPFSLKVSFYFMTKIPLRNYEKDILNDLYFSRNKFQSFYFMHNGIVQPKSFVAENSC